MDHKWKPDAMLINYGPTGPMLKGTMTGGGVAVADEAQAPAQEVERFEGQAEPQPRYVMVCQVFMLKEGEHVCPQCAHGHLKAQWTYGGEAVLYRCMYCARHFIKVERL